MKPRGRTAGRPLLALLRKPWQTIVIRVNVSGRVRHGREFRLGQGSTVSSAHGLVIGDHVAIGRNCTVEVCGRIGDYTLVAAAVGIVGRKDHDHNAVGVPIRYTTWVGDRACAPTDCVDIGTDVWVGYGACILSGVVVGDGAVVAARSLVTRDVPAFAVVAGSPAQVVGWRFSSPDERERHLRSLRTAPHSDDTP